MSFPENLQFFEIGQVTLQDLTIENDTNNTATAQNIRFVMQFYLSQFGFKNDFSGRSHYELP